MTLIEVLMAATTLTIGLGGSALLQVQANRMMRTSEETALAAGLLRAQVADMSVLSKEQLTDGTYVPGEWFDAEGPLKEGSFLFETPGWGIGDALPDVLHFMVTLQWTPNQGPERTMTLHGVVK